MKTFRRLSFLSALLAVSALASSAHAQSLPCAAITRNPQALKAMLDSHSQSVSSDTMTLATMEHMHFNPVVLQAGDALYMEYRGKDFSVNAHFASGEFLTFDSTPAATEQQWRKAILPLDIFGSGLQQKFVHLSGTARSGDQVLVRNVRIIRAGDSVFQFQPLAAYGKAQIKLTTARALPCKGIAEYPSPDAARTAANHAASSGNGTRVPLTMTAQQVNQMVLDSAPPIHPGDFMAFEANRKDFVFYILLSNGKQIVTKPLTSQDADDTTVAWRKGHIRLDYPETLNQRIVRQRVVLLHQDGTPLLLRAMKIDGNGKLIFELENSQPGAQKPPIDPPMSYPPDPQVMMASASIPDIWGRRPEIGYLTPKLPAYSMHPVLFQSATDTIVNNYKFTGAELDAETGLYYMGARHYSPALGRFIQPDPLYIDFRRLSDPQQLNLYSYGRNNPTTFSDPTGLDITLGCKGAQANCNTALGQLNGRENAQFTVGLDKNNKLTVDGKVDSSKLSKSEKALFSAINDSDNHATLNIVNQNGTVNFGLHNSPGVNTVDVADTAKLNGPNNAGGLNAGDAVAHEGIQAYFSLFNDAQSDNQASQFFPGLNNPLSAFIYNKAGTEATGSLIKGSIADGRGDEIIKTTFRTPIPAIDIFTKGSLRATQGAERDIDEVKFVPATPK